MRYPRAWRTGVAVTAALAACCAAVVVAACGSTGSPEEEVTKSVREWTAALSEGDGEGTCARMTAGGQTELARFAQTFAQTAPAAACPANVKRFHAKLSPQVQRQTLDADVDDVRLDGDVAVVRMARGGPTQVRLRREDGKWRVDEAFRHGWRLIGAPNYAQGFR
jgi:hypothetical protein